MKERNRLSEFLADPGQYPEHPETIEHFETHISNVYAGETTVYKVKKPVALGFLDFTTLRRRHHYCVREVELNSRLAKSVYLGVVPIYSAKGTYSFSPLAGGKVVEYAVKMKRIDNRRILAELISGGEAIGRDLRTAALTIARFHRNARAYHGRYYGGARSVVMDNEEDFTQIAPFVGKTITGEAFRQIVDYTRQFITDHAKLIVDRKHAGLVREIHGDLHAQHITVERKPVIFDCIEFNNRFRIADVLEDIAFLLMDLEYRGRPDLAAIVRAAYFSSFPAARHDEHLAFYKVYRAVVRGKVESFMSASLAGGTAKKLAVTRAGHYFALARHYITAGETGFNPFIVMGPSGSGKSFIARRFAKNALILRSDEIRKEIAGVPRFSHREPGYGRGIYSDAMTAGTYDALLERTLARKNAGKPVIVDATFGDRKQRSRFAGKCIAGGMNPLFIFCTADRTVLEQRVSRREKSGRDVSDAGLEVLRQQLVRFNPPDELESFRLLRLNTDREISKIQETLGAVIG